MHDPAKACQELLKENAVLKQRIQELEISEAEHKQAEDALSESEKRYRELVDFLPIALFEIDLEYNIIAGNPAIFETFMYTPVDLERGLNVRQMLSPEDIKRMQNDVPPILKGMKTKGPEYLGIRKDGSKFPFIIFTSPIIRGGHPVGLRGAIIDITERKQAEEEKRSLEERLSRAEKMESLGTLAGGVAHDLNNVLGVLVGFSELLAESLLAGSPLKRYADNILQASMKGSAIIQDLLTLARRGVNVSKVFDLNKVVSDYLTTPEFEKLIFYHPDVKILTELEEGLLNIKGSPIHFGKTIMNLVSNAVESISGSGKITIKTENRYLDQPIRGYDEIQEGDYAILMVSDTGSGFSVDKIDKIFEPFYTKKVMGRSGTGLGLAVVWGTVKDHHGYIDVQSEEGKGSTFTLYFPVTREYLAKSQDAVSIEAYMGRGESILVVDDLQEQRDLAMTMLRRLGYQVEAVASGEEAIEYLKNKKTDLIVLDMIMDPGIDGMETYRRIREINPGQKAVIVSGFSETERVRSAQEMGAGAFVSKPYILEKIGLGVRKELDRR